MEHALQGTILNDFCQELCMRGVNAIVYFACNVKPYVGVTFHAHIATCMYLLYRYHHRQPV